MSQMIDQLHRDLNAFFGSKPKGTPEAEVPSYCVEFGEDGDVQPRFIVGPLTTEVHVYPINDTDYTHAALVLVDGTALPMGCGRSKATSEAAAISMAASNAGAKDYTVVITTAATLFN